VALAPDGMHQLRAALNGAGHGPDRERGADPLSAMPDLVDGSRGAPLPSVSVVVPTRRELGRLERCLRSLLVCNYDDFEVIVVEHRRRASMTARMLVEQFPDEGRLRYVEESWRSTSVARNAGLARAEGEIVAFTDAGVVVDPQWLRASVAALLRERTIGCVIGLVAPSNLGNSGQAQSEQFAGVTSGLHPGVYRPPSPTEQNPLRSFGAGALGWGASMVMRTELVRELGGFDAALGPATPTASGEDVDLLNRLLQTGHSFAYEPRAIVRHQGSGGPARPRREAYRDGVALGAVLCKQLVTGPARRGFVRTAPAGLRRSRDPGSPLDGRRPEAGQTRHEFLRTVPAGLDHRRADDRRHDADEPSNQPRRRRWLGRFGMLVGSIAYLVSALIVRVRRIRHREPPSPRPLRLVRRVVVGGETINVAWFKEPAVPRVRFVWRGSAEQGRKHAGVRPAPARPVAIPPPAAGANGALRLSAVVPTRNAEAWIESCVRAIRDNGAAEVILVDGGSTDRTVELARPWVDTVLDDGGAGVAAARMLGVVSASEPWIALVDADVVLPPGALRDLDRERHERGLGALQAGLRSVGAGDYWSQSLADHHNHGHSKRWFGVCASVIARDILLAQPLDAHLRSGEDIDLRIRLTRAGMPIGVSEDVIGQHRFGDGFAFARDQWVADGAGLGRMVRKHGSGALVNAMIPFGAAALGIVRGMRDAFRPWPYFIGFAIGNYIGLWRGLLDRSVPSTPRSHTLLVAGMLVWLLAMPAVLAVVVAALALVMLSVGHAAYEGHLLLATLIILAVAVPFEVASGAASGRFSAVARRVAPLTAWAMAIGLILSGVRLARVVGL
jgi:glycosyltransferase involved in cell wall biosynthesis